MTSEEKIKKRCTASFDRLKEWGLSLIKKEFLKQIPQPYDHKQRSHRREYDKAKDWLYEEIATFMQLLANQSVLSAADYVGDEKIGQLYSNTLSALKEEIVLAEKAAPAADANPLVGQTKSGGQ